MMARGIRAWLQDSSSESTMVSCARVQIGEASRQRDAAVQQLNAQLAWNRRYLADLQIFLNQRSAASR
jgi:hypothetical protein